MSLDNPARNTQHTIRNILLVVAKRPAPGQTKTRLTPPLTPEQASALYECFLRDTLDVIRQAATHHPIQPAIAYLPANEADYFRQLAPDFALLLQEGPDLGVRLDNALTSSLGGGYERAVIMDSDSPTLPAASLVEAFTALDHADVTLGPCADGGYYLIGLKHPAPRLLREVTMSTPTVLQDTIALAEQEGLTVHLLPTWYDVDTVAELDQLIDELRSASDELAPHTRTGLRPLFSLTP